jgi:hypothetical protein
MANDQAHLLWYSREELDTIMERNMIIVNHVRDNNGDCNVGKGKRLCIRGLEKMLNPGYHLVQRDMAKKVVLAEQNVHIALAGRFDEEVVRSLYKIVAHSGQVAALEKGFKDAKEVQLYSQSTTRGTIENHQKMRHTLFL